jgi:putative ABC transport system substrate-binding protein
MKRREFISLLGGAAASWPLTTRAQQPAMPVVGLLHPASPDTLANRLRGFRQGLKETGLVEDENVAIEHAGPRIKWIGCRSWRPHWFAAKFP